MHQLHNSRQMRCLSKCGSFWRDDQANGKTGHQTAEMGRRTDLWGRNVEQDLDDDDQKDVEKTLLCLPHVAMTNEKSGPRANNSHDAAGCANKFGGANDL